MVIFLGVVCSFKVIVLNKGGESFLLEIFFIGKIFNDKGIVLIINGFDWVCVFVDFMVDVDILVGFLDELDYGVFYKIDISYIGLMKEFCW